jgi:predicted acetylornithine/succinylornithine family transaminase
MNVYSPQPSAEQILDREAESVLNTYPRLPVVIDHGKGVYLWDTEGHRYLDLMSGLGVSALGHAHPRLVAAMSTQAAQLIHLSNLYSNRWQGELAEKLCHLSGMRAAFFATGGAEAVESALKLARSWAIQNFSSSKTGFVALEQSYHGRSFGALSVTGQPRYRERFGPTVPGVQFARFNDIASLAAVVNQNTCAIILEPLMGEGGVRECSQEFLEAARRLADQHHALLIFDEIQCGLGRTGTWFAAERSGVQPDIFLVGKPLAGGLPLSAMLVADGKDLPHTLLPGQHGSTLGGSPLACRMGLEFLAIVEDEGLLEQIQDTGSHLKRGLEMLVPEVPVASSSRGAGLLQALELSIPARPILEAGLGQGLLLNSVQGTILRFLPPYILLKSHVDETLEKLHSLLMAASPQPSATEYCVVPNREPVVEAVLQTAAPVA